MSDDADAPIQTPELAPKRGGGRVAATVVVALIVALSGMVGAAILVRGGGRARGGATAVTADMPLAPGDKVTLQLAANATTEALVIAIADDGVVVQALGETAPQRAARTSLTVLGFAADASRSRPDVGDLVLARTSAGWVRREVLGPAPNGGLALHGLGADASEDTAEPGALVRVQTAFDATMEPLVPVPAGAPAEPADGARLVLVRPLTRLAKGDRVLIPPAAERGWLRATVSEDRPHGAVAVIPDGTPTIVVVDKSGALRISSRRR